MKQNLKNILFTAGIIASMSMCILIIGLELAEIETSIPLKIGLLLFMAVASIRASIKIWN